MIFNPTTIMQLAIVGVLPFTNKDDDESNDAW